MLGVGVDFSYGRSDSNITRDPLLLREEKRSNEKVIVKRDSEIPKMQGGERDAAITLKKGWFSKLGVCLVNEIADN